jgi:hypothetical protein
VGDPALSRCHLEPGRTADSCTQVWRAYTYSRSPGAVKPLPVTTCCNAPLPTVKQVYAATTFKYVFAFQPGDVYWCTADCGWITGGWGQRKGARCPGPASSCTGSESFWRLTSCGAHCPAWSKPSPASAWPALLTL